MISSYKKHFQHALQAAPERLHFAAHSHHLWPDVTRDAHLQCWDAAAAEADRKWDAIFEMLIPNVQEHIARLLNLSDPNTIAFAPNTHELVMRLLSCMPTGRPSRILTTDSEFHSFSRQIARLEEAGQVQVTRVPTRPFDGFVDRFTGVVAKGGYDMVYVSQTFYNSGYVIADLHAVIDAVTDDDCFIVIDGYHGFMALPTNFGASERRAFYLAGGYKYAMAGEGACFMHCPDGFGARPRDTGWLAAFAALEKQGGDTVPYGACASRFFGATFDPSGLYRFQAVQSWLQKEGITVADIHAHVQQLQSYFIERLEDASLGHLPLSELMLRPPSESCGHFLTFETARAGALYEALLGRHVLTDYRGDRLRFGFGLYHDRADVGGLIDRLCYVG